MACKVSIIKSIVGGNWELGADEHSIMGGEIGIMCMALITSQHSALQTHTGHSHHEVPSSFLIGAE